MKKGNNVTRKYFDAIEDTIDFVEMDDEFWEQVLESPYTRYNKKTDEYVWSEMSFHRIPQKTNHFVYWENDCDEGCEDEN